MHNREQSPIHGPICHMSLLVTMSYITLILVSLQKYGPEVKAELKNMHYLKNSKIIVKP